MVIKIIPTYTSNIFFKLKINSSIIHYFNSFKKKITIQLLCLFQVSKLEKNLLKKLNMACKQNDKNQH